MDKKTRLKAALARGETAASRELHLLVETGDRVRELCAITQVCCLLREEAVMNNKAMMTAASLAWGEA